MAPLAGSMAALAWQPGSNEGLATVEAFRADPTDVGAGGEMIGFAALPAILMAQPALAYPLRLKEALLPTMAEMGEIFRRAWVVDDIPATVH